MRDLGFTLAWMAMLVPVLQGGAAAAVLLWAWTSLLAPNDVLYGFAVGIPFTKLASAIAIPMLLLGRGGGGKFRFTPTTLLMLALCVSALVSELGTVAADTGLGWDLYQKLAKILLLAAIVTAVMRDRLRIHALLFAICLGIGFTGMQEALKWLVSGGGHVIQGSPSTGDNNQIGLDVLLIVPLLAHLHGVCRNRLARLGCVVMGLLCVICAVATNSRGAFVGMVVLALGLVTTGRRKLVGLVVIGFLALAGSQMLPESYFHRLDTIQQANDDSSFEGRVVAWKMSLLEAFERPLFGGGMHAIQMSDVWERYRPRFDTLSFIPSMPVGDVHAAHSIYFEVLGDLGFVGLGLFLSLMAIALRNARVIRLAVRRSGRDDLLWAADLARKLQLSVLIFLVSGAALSAAYYDIDYLLVAMLAALRDVVGREIGGVAQPAGRFAPLRQAAGRYVPETVARSALPP